MTLSIRVADPDDAAAISGLIAVMGYDVAAADVRRRLLALPDHHRVFVAQMDPDVVGWVHVLTADSVIAGSRAEIGGIAVAPGVQGNGIGSALLQAAESWAAQQGVHSVQLRSGTERSAAHTFYLGHGYRARKTQVAFTKPVTPASDDPALRRPR